MIDPAFGKNKKEHEMEVQHLSQKELADRWRISPYTLEKWRMRGLGPCYIKLGNRVVYRLLDIEAHEASHTHAGTSQPISCRGGEV
ncbi:AlpA family transcriptional regulator [Endozoicomonas sp. SESOKO4]|uniref:helix-turn-helix transcriptional regulator n=2 Tax=unclassified Endozoicomonas TaxID=2644528 RepID=UPI00214898AB|nr:helix-turn-helix domain-containing protein [Endozoicomonas sp. SESOKO4]